MIFRTGIGFDAHRFKRGRRLVLGGVHVPGATGLDGHSDADVVCHAVMDAALGAIAAGDIGEHFPDTDARWKGADSIGMLRAVAGLLRRRGWRVVNVDCTVLAQAPRIAPHREAMRMNMARALGIGTEVVSVKATTTERMGAIGRKEGIAALAVATVRKAPRR